MKLSKNMIMMLLSVWEHTEAKVADRSTSWYCGRWHMRTATAVVNRGLVEENKSYGTLLANGKKDRQTMVLSDAGRKALEDMVTAEGLTIDQWAWPARPDWWRDPDYTASDLERAWRSYDLRNYGEAQDRTDYIAECIACSPRREL